MVTWGRVTRSDVLHAAEEYDRLGAEGFFSAHGFGPARSWGLRWSTPSATARESGGSGSHALGAVAVAAFRSQYSRAETYRREAACGFRNSR
jgi:hypothetical protein